MPAWLEWSGMGLMLGIATVTDLQRRKVPGWVTWGGLAVALIAAAIVGRGALEVSLTGLKVAGVMMIVLLPLVFKHWLGLADALLLVGIGAWAGGQFLLQSAWYASLAGGILYVVARWRHERTVPYVPAIALGVIAATFVRM